MDDCNNTISGAHQQRQPLLSDYIPPPQSPPTVYPRNFSSFHREIKTKGQYPSSPRSSMQNDLDAQVPVARKVKHNRRVSFDPVLQVRTHTVILGDHPCCSGGMALQCGWESADQSRPLEEGAASRGRRNWNQSKRRLAELRLSYAERRERLQELTGLTGSQLLQEEYNLVCCSVEDNHQAVTHHCGLHHAPTQRQLATFSDV